MKKFALRIFFFVFVPLLAGEALCRAVWYTPTWYEAAPALLSTTPGVFFLGSSRTGAAVDPAVVQSTLRESLRRDVPVYSFGRGGATMAMHLFGLRQLIRARPQALKNALVLVEALEGVPYNTTWQEDWAGSNPELLIPLLQASDFRRFWTSPLDVNTKSYLTVAHYCKLCALLPQWQTQITHAGETAVSAGLMRLRAALYPGRPVQQEPEEMRSVAGVRGDAVGIRHVRSYILAHYPARLEALKNLKPFVRWDETILRELVDYVHAQGGHVAFFEMPLSSVIALEYRSPVGQQDRATFYSKAREWGSEVLRPAFKYDDSDFPDLSHLKTSRVSEYSTLVTQEMLRLGRL